MQLSGGVSAANITLALTGSGQILSMEKIKRNTTKLDTSL
jgi:hypothetical protein